MKRKNPNILEVIKSTLKEMAEMDEINIPGIDVNTPLYGTRGYLDSMALVSFIAGVEKELSEMGYNVTIASEKAFSRKISPFLSVKTLERFIKKLIEEAENAE